MVNSRNEADISPLIDSTCQSDGQWSKNILDYQCLGSVIFVLIIYIIVNYNILQKLLMRTINLILKISILRMR